MIKRNTDEIQRARMLILKSIGMENNMFWYPHTKQQLPKNCTPDLAKLIQHLTFTEAHLMFELKLADKGWFEQWKQHYGKIFPAEYKRWTELYETPDPSKIALPKPGLPDSPIERPKLQPQSESWIPLPSWGQPKTEQVVFKPSVRSSVRGKKRKSKERPIVILDSPEQPPKKKSVIDLSSPKKKPMIDRDYLPKPIIPDLRKALYAKLKMWKDQNATPDTPQKRKTKQSCL